MTIFLLKKLNFISIASTIASTLISVAGLFTAVDIGDRAEAIVVTGNPNDYIVKPGTGYDGVVKLQINRVDLSEGLMGACTGSLLPTGLHILTAAHCLTQTDQDLAVGGVPGKFDTSNTSVLFELNTFPPRTFYSKYASEFYVHPSWNGIKLDGNDIAIIKLADEAPVEADRYDIYRHTDEIGQVVTKVGYGQTGNGNTGATIEDLFKRSGQNTYDALGEIINSVAGTNIPNGITLSYDFDNGLAANDFFGYYFAIPNTGLGINEVNGFKGDSGGPGFINGLIAGISSFSANPLSVPPDIDNQLNGSFGEFSSDTRVSSYVSYIDDVLAGKIAPTYKIPEPSTLVGIVFVGAIALNSGLRKKVIK